MRKKLDTKNEKKIFFKNCWEYMECPDKLKSKCIVHINNFGKECYLLQDIKNICPKSLDFNNCEDCGWYKICVKN